MNQKHYTRALALVIVALMAVTLLPGVGHAATCSGTSYETHIGGFGGFSTDWIPLGNGTHAQTGVCSSCGQTVVMTAVTCSDSDNNGVCDVCGGSMGGSSDAPKTPPAPPAPPATNQCDHGSYRRIPTNVGYLDKHRIVCAHCGAPYEWAVHVWKQVGDHYECVCGASTASMNEEQRTELEESLEEATDEQLQEAQAALEEVTDEQAQETQAALEEATQGRDDSEQPAGETQTVSEQQSAVQESSGQTTIPADSIPNEDVLSQEDWDRLEAERNHCYCDDPYTGERRRCD